MAYATVVDLAGAPYNLTPANAQLLLDRASRDVDRALLCAIYDADASGNPTDAAVIAAFKNATLEQVAGNLNSGDSAGLGRSTSGFTLGRLSVQRASSSASSSDPAAPKKIGTLWEQAWQVLQDPRLAGKLTFYGPQTW